MRPVKDKSNTAEELIRTEKRLYLCKTFQLRNQTRRWTHNDQPVSYGQTRTTSTAGQAEASVEFRTYQNLEFVFAEAEKSAEV
jgi:hypothetical protein